MKLLIVVRPFSFHGGVESATAGLLRALVEHGHEVHALSSGAVGVAEGVTLHRVRMPPLPPAARLIAFALGARRFVTRGAWDIVQSHERTITQDLYRAGEGCHRAYLESGVARAGRRGYHRVVLALERQVFKRSRHVVAIAKTGKSDIERLYDVPAARLSVIYNGVDLQRFHPLNRERHREAGRRDAGIPADSWVVLFVGSGFERKGLATLIEAVGQLRDRASRLIVVGKGDVARYRAMAHANNLGDRVVFVGPKPDIERWYALADMVALPALYEPFGNVHLEALASGIPVVTSTRTGGSEVIVDGSNGAVVEPRDARALAAALERIRGADQFKMSEAARASAEPFTYARQVRELASIYRGLGAASADFP